MDQPPTQLYEPSPRFKHVKCAISDGEILMWGGQTSECYSKDGQMKLAQVVEHFDPCKEVWSQLTTEGTPHPGFSDAASCLLGDNLFLYGGISNATVTVCSDCVSGELSCLNTKTLAWSQPLCTEMEESGRPMKKTGSGLVHFGHDKLAVIGGYGFPTGPAQSGSSVKKNPRFDDGRGYSNEFHVLDLSQGKVSCGNETR